MWHLCVGQMMRQSGESFVLPIGLGFCWSTRRLQHRFRAIRSRTGFGFPQTIVTCELVSMPSRFERGTRSLSSLSLIATVCFG